MDITVKQDSHMALGPSGSRLEAIPVDPHRLDLLSPPGVGLGDGQGRSDQGPAGGGGRGMHLNKPVAFHLQESPKRPHKCQHCIKAFPNTQQLSQHMLVHNGIRKYKCVFCDKAFKQLSHVQQHQRRHTGETPYKCRVEGCERAFAQMSNLQQHMRNHDNVKDAPDRKPYQCNVCARRFTAQTSLKNHMAKMHELGPTGINFNIDADKKFACTVCGKRFVRERGLMKHIENTHSERGGGIKMRLKVCTCPVCQKVFSRESYLLRHVQMKWDEGHRQELLKMEQSHIASLGGYANLNPNALKKEIDDTPNAGQQSTSMNDTGSSSMDLHRRRTPDQPMSPQMDMSSRRTDDNRVDSMGSSSADNHRGSGVNSQQLGPASSDKDLAMQLESFRAYANQSTMPTESALQLLQHQHQQAGHLSPAGSYKHKLTAELGPPPPPHGMDMHHRGLMPPQPVYSRDNASDHVSPADMVTSRSGMMSPDPKQMSASSTPRPDYRDDNNRGNHGNSSSGGGGSNNSSGASDNYASIQMSAPLFRPETFSPNPLLNANADSSNKLASMAHIRASYRAGMAADNLQMNLNPAGFNMWPRLGGQVCWPYQNQLPPGMPPTSGPVTSSADHAHDKYN